MTPDITDAAASSKLSPAGLGIRPAARTTVCSAKVAADGGGNLAPVEPPALAQRARPRRAEHLLAGLQAGHVPAHGLDRPATSVPRTGVRGRLTPYMSPAFAFLTPPPGEWAR